MELLCDGAIAALSAIGLTAVIWVLAGAILHPRRRDLMGTVAVVPASGAAENLEYTVRTLLRTRYEAGGFTRIVILDGGLDTDAQKVADLLCRSEYDVAVCRKEDLLENLEIE